MRAHRAVRFKAHRYKIDPSGGSDQQRSRDLPDEEGAWLRHALTVRADGHKRISEVHDEFGRAVRACRLWRRSVRLVIGLQRPVAAHDAVQRWRRRKFAILHRVAKCGQRVAFLQVNSAHCA